MDDDSTIRSGVAHSAGRGMCRGGAAKTLYSDGRNQPNRGTESTVNPL